MWKYANTQRALYPNGGCISTGGAVLPAWFFNRPLYPAHVDASDSEFQKLLLVSELVLSWRAFPQRMIPLSCGCSHNPFFLKEIKAYSSFSHLFSLDGTWAPGVRRAVWARGVRAVVQFGVESSVLCPVLGQAMWRMGR